MQTKAAAPSTKLKVFSSQRSISEMRSRSISEGLVTDSAHKPALTLVR